MSLFKRKDPDRLLTTEEMLRYDSQNFWGSMVFSVALLVFLTWVLVL